MNPQAYYQLRHLLTDKFQWNDHKVTVRLVTINTKEVAHAITPELTELWAVRFAKFIKAVSAIRPDSQSRKLAFSPVARKLLADLRPKLELSTTHHIHLHFVSWEVDGESAFDSAPAIRVKVMAKASKILAACSINNGQAQELLTVVDGGPKFDRHGQSSVIRSYRYISGGQSHELPLDQQEASTRTLRKRQLIDRHLSKVATGRSLIDTALRAHLANCCQQAQIDDDGLIEVEASRTKPVYRRLTNLFTLIHELNLLGEPWSFEHPAFINLFDPFGQLARAAQSVIDRRPIDLSGWVDRGEVFATLYENRGRQRCLIAIRPLLELMDQHLFAWTHESAEFHSRPIYWDCGTPVMSRLRKYHA